MLGQTENAGADRNSRAGGREPHQPSLAAEFILFRGERFGLDLPWGIVLIQGHTEASGYRKFIRSIEWSTQSMYPVSKTRFLLSTGLVFFVSLALHAQQGSWRIDSNHSGAHFAVRHMMISTVRGEFTGIAGTVIYDPKDPTHDSVEVTIDCSTVNTGVAKRDAQLKGPDFFDVARYPQMKFKSTRVGRAGEGKLKVTGELTINSTTKLVVLDVDGPSPSIRDPGGNEKIGLSANTKISRKEFGITWNEVMEAGGIAVADEVAISLDLELIKNPKVQ
jgi:polyisoprenoid-binding protein YceI